MVYLDTIFDIKNNLGQGHDLSEHDAQILKTYVNNYWMQSENRFATIATKFVLYVTNINSARYSVGFTVHPGFAINIFVCDYNVSPGGIFNIRIGPLEKRYWVQKLLST